MSSGSRISAQVRPEIFSLPDDARDRRLYPHGVLRKSVLLLDGLLRHVMRIHEFSANPTCLLRIAITRTRNTPKLLEHVTIRPSDQIIDLHFWNEHFESLLTGRAPCIRGRLVYRHLQNSMTLLAAYLLTHPEISAQTIHARVAMPLGGRFAKFKLLAESYGFKVTVSPVRGMTRVHDFFEGFLIRALLWAFNPGPAKRRRLQLCRADLWMDRNTLLRRYFVEMR